MEEQLILRVPPSVAERIDRLLNDNGSSEDDKSLDLSFSEDGRSGTFVIGEDHFPVSISHGSSLCCGVIQTYDDCALVKTVDIGQMITVREPGESTPDVVKYRHGLTPPMRDARKRRFRRELDLNPDLVQRVEKDLVNIMTGATVESADPEVNEQEGGDASKKDAPSLPAPKQPDIAEARTNTGAPERSDSDDSM